MCSRWDTGIELRERVELAHMVAGAASAPAANAEPPGPSRRIFASLNLSSPTAIRQTSQPWSRSLPASTATTKTTSATSTRPPTTSRCALRELTLPVEEGFRLAIQDRQIVGVLGIEADPEIGRAGSYGPLVRHPQWQAVADQLYAAALPAIPPGIGQQQIL